MRRTDTAFFIGQTGSAGGIRGRRPPASPQRFVRNAAPLLAAAIVVAASSHAAAATYDVASNTAFRNAINTANTDGQASTIRLTGNIILPQTTPLPNITAPLTIDTNGQTLQAEDGTSVDDGENLIFPVASGVTLEIIDDAGGLVIGGQGGDLGSASEDGGDGGIGALLPDGDLTNRGTISGGDGGDASGSFDDGGDGGVGVLLDEGNLLTNQGTISGGNGGSSSDDNGGDGGIGAVVDETGGRVVNQGTIAGGDGGDALGADDGFGGNGGIGLRLDEPGRLNNHGTILGGDGGDSTGGGFSGGSGGFGVLLTEEGRVDNWGTIRGGAGGLGDDGTGSGGTGVLIQGAGGQVHNRGLIAGGSGSGAGLFDGGHGILHAGGDGRVINSGTIRGGSGSFAAGILFFGIPQLRVEGEQEINATAADSGTVVINSGLISGGNSVSGGAPTPFSGGPGILFFTQNALVKNSGTIKGGQGAPGSTQGTPGIISFQNLTVINSGTISGGLADGGNGPRGPAILFGEGTNRLELRPGFEINGLVDATTADEDTFALGGGGSDTFDLDQIDNGFGPPEQYQGFEHFEKTGPSTWTLTGSGTTSLWTIKRGTLAVNGTLNAPVSILAPGILGGTGNVIGSVTNQGAVAPGNSIGTLLIDGDYASSGGSLRIETNLNPASPSADRLLISGDVSGRSVVEVRNIGGVGLTTGEANTDGLSIVQVGGRSAAESFHLAGDYVAIGPYRYELNAFSPGQSAASELDPRLAARSVRDFWDYRLQSVGIVPQIPAYQALPTAALQYGFALFDNLHKRLGEIHHVTELRRSPGGTSYESFFRARGRNGAFKGGDGPDFEQDMWFVQAGANLVGWGGLETNDSLRMGMAFAYGRSQLAVQHPAAEAVGANLKSPSLALTSTYMSAGGWYIDTVLRGIRYDAEVTTAARGQAAEFDGWGGGASVEAGYPFLIATRTVLEPQMQLAYQRIWFDSEGDVDGLLVDFHDTDGLRGRIGGRLQRTFVNGEGDDQQLWSPYVSANVTQGFLGGGSVSAGGVNFLTDETGTGMLFAGGLNAQLGQRWGIYSNATYIEGFGDGTIDYAWAGTGGVRVNF